MRARIGRMLACLALVSSALVLLPGTASAANGTCTTRGVVAGPYFSGKYVVAGYAVSVTCTQKNVIEAVAVSQPAANTTSTSETFDKEICQAKTCIASTAWAVDVSNGLPVCWVDFGRSGAGTDYGVTVHPSPPDFCV